MRSMEIYGQRCDTRRICCDVKFGVIVDVEASRSIRQAEVGAAKTMIARHSRIECGGVARAVRASLKCGNSF